MSRSREAKALRTKQTGMQSPPAPGHSRRIVVWICAGLAMLVLTVFSQTIRHDFVNFDDQEYVYQNPAVKGGLSLNGIAWAFTKFHSSNWHPVTWVSHMADCQIYGLKPWGHHLTNVLLQAATVVMLFLALQALTALAGRHPRESLWCAAWAAALWGVHPLRVESVAWVAERKDLLSGLFFMLTLWAYARYARARVPGARFPVPNYLAVLLFFALGLMSKPMLVTVPFVLLLLDIWPLGRLRLDSTFNFQHSSRLILEKVPLFCLSVLSSVVTVLAQRGATESLKGLPLFSRICNALVACATYFRQTVWPTDLAVLYPHPMNRLPLSAVVTSILLVTMVSLAVFVFRRRLPYALTGWLWFLGMLVPVIGVIQVGVQSHADRYTYLPQIGLFIILVWGVAQVSEGWRHRRFVCGAAAGLMLLALAGCTWVQISYWQDSITLWNRALHVTSRNYVAHNNLGATLVDQGQTDSGIAHFWEALRFEPNYVDAHGNLGRALALQGDYAESAFHYHRALEINPHRVSVISSFGTMLQGQSKFAEAIEQFDKALKLAPSDYATLNNLGWLLATCPDASFRDGPRAVALSRKAVTYDRGVNPAVLDTLAATYAEAGRFSEAVATARHALDLAMKENDQALAEEIRARFKHYEAGKPYHEEERKQ